MRRTHGENQEAARVGRRGLTLVEVLAATVLLAILAAVAVGFVRDAARSASQPIARTHAVAAHADLARCIDRVFSHDHALRARLTARSRFEPFEFQPESSDERRPSFTSVRVARLDANDPNADHAWAVFEGGDARVLRFVRLASPDAAPRSERGPRPGRREERSP